MVEVARLIGREAELARLQEALARAGEGRGSLLLVCGEAGVGKTRLLDALAAGASASVLRGAATSSGAAGYEPVAAALRSRLRSAPGDVSRLGALRPALAAILPELGPPDSAPDRATLIEAVRCALETVASDGAVLVVLDDLQWSDDATLELLGRLATALDELAVLIVAAYRADETPRGHSLRRLRDELRRHGRLSEIALGPFDEAGTAALLEQALGGAASPSVIGVVHGRTRGNPFFAAELSVALLAHGRLRERDGTFELAGEDAIPLPDTIRDAVLLRVAELSDSARDALAAASLAGAGLGMDVLEELASEDGVAEALASELLVQLGPGVAAFRHELAREAVHSTVAWSRRRRIHARLARALEDEWAPAARVAEHWLGAGETERGRSWLVRAAEQLCAVHAHRDAAAAAGRALDLWPDGDDDPGRRAVLELLARCAELSGDLVEAARALSEAREGCSDPLAAARLDCRLATAYELQGDLERALAARRAGTDALAGVGRLDEAATQRLLTALRLEGIGSLRAALEEVTRALGEARACARADLEVRALGYRGDLRAKLGELAPGLEDVRAALSLALDRNLTAAAAEAYTDLAVVLHVSSDYPGARDAFETAMSFCAANGEAAMGEICLGCLVYILLHAGEWDRATKLAGEILDPSHSLIAADGETPVAIALVRSGIVAAGMLGCVRAFRGDPGGARSLLADALGRARFADYYSMEIWCLWGLAYADVVDARHESATAHGREILAQWGRTDDRHMAICPLRWASSHFAGRAMEREASACADALGTIAADTGKPEALAGVAHAIGEIALLAGDSERAAAQLGQSLALIEGLELPFERAQTALRAGVALTRTGRREQGVEQLVAAHRAARRLGARPLAAEASQVLASLGEPLERRLGRRAAAEHAGGGLSRREQEVVRLVATGQTNKQIAGQLVVSTRTVDMHVRNILAKLDCRSRAEAAAKAGKLGLLS